MTPPATRLAAILALSAAATLTATAQQSGTRNDWEKLSGYLERSEQTQKLLLEGQDAILTKITGIESALAKPTEPTPPSATPELASKLAELEAAITKLQSAPPPAAEPAPEPAAATLQLNLNIVWIVVTGAMVFFMQAGFCLLELGFTRAKNAINICMKNFLDFSVGAVCFLFVGFGLMFGASASGWIGQGPFWLSNTPGNDPFWAFWFFQVVFSGTAATIISGAMAERTKFVGYLCYTAVMTAAIYPIIGHWAWGSFGGGFGYGGDKGWLESMGFADFAGSSVVHGIGGAAALAGVLIVGARHGRFKPDGTPVLVTGHNLPLAALGTFILWFGWYGFNPGSTLVGDPSIGRIAVNTTLAPSAGAIAGMILMWVFQGRPDLGMTLNGALGGLVGITASCNVVTPASAVLIGLAAGVITTFGAILLEKIRVDDAVGAVPVHLFCGWWGTLAVALFHEQGFSLERLQTQAIGTLSITGTAFVAALVAFKVIDLVVGLRTKDDEQDLGLDFTEHSGNAYPDFVTTDQGAMAK